MFAIKITTYLLQFFWAWLAKLSKIKYSFVYDNSLVITYPCFRNFFPIELQA